MVQRLQDRVCFICQRGFVCHGSQVECCSDECRKLAEDPNMRDYCCKREDGYLFESFEQYLALVSLPCSICGLTSSELGNKKMYIITPKQPTVICRYCRSIRDYDVQYALKSLSARRQK